MRQPVEELIADMVTCSVGIQTSCPNSPVSMHQNNMLIDYKHLCPSHFTEVHVTKLEDAFSKKQKPDDIQLRVLAMECNLLYKDVKNWFKARRLKWITDLVQYDESCKNYTNSNSDIITCKLDSCKIDRNNNKMITDKLDSCKNETNNNNSNKIIANELELDLTPSKQATNSIEMRRTIAPTT